MAQEIDILMAEEAREIRKSKKFRWAPGMMRLRDCSSHHRDFLKKESRVPDSHDDFPYDDWEVIPDLRDPATFGVLLQGLRESKDWGFSLQEESDASCKIVLLSGGKEVYSSTQANRFSCLRELYQKTSRFP